MIPIQLVNVGVAFGERYVLRGVNLQIEKGECFAIIGPSGEGKTTLLKVMAGLLTPTDGKVLFDGAELERLSPKLRHVIRRRIGMTFQRSGLFDSMTCGENLRFPLREVSKLREGLIDQKVDEALREVGLSGIDHKLVHEISGGMQKRLGIARALVLSPEIILYDDPTAGLDPVTSRHIIELLLEMKKKYDMTVVLVTSDLKQALRAGDRIGFLYKGDFVEISSSESIRASKNAVVNQFVHGFLEGPLTQYEEEPHDRV